MKAGTTPFHSLVLFDQPSEDDIAKQQCDAMGVITTELLREWCPIETADFYFCGPAPFMRAVFASLTSMGVESERMHHEFFGPQQSLQRP